MHGSDKMEHAYIISYCELVYHTRTMKGLTMEIGLTRKRWQIALAVAIVASGIAGVGLSVHDQGLEIFDAYTENSNIFNLISSSIYFLCLIGILPIKTNRGIKFIKQLRYLSTCCLALTFIVVLFVLAPMDGISGYKEWFFSGSMFFNHLLTPALSLLSFIVLEKEPVLSQNNSWYALIPTFLYAAVTVTLNALGVLDGPYPFLRVRNQSIMTSILWIVIVFSVNYILSAIVLRLNRKARI